MRSRSSLNVHGKASKVKGAPCYVGALSQSVDFLGLDDSGNADKKSHSHENGQGNLGLEGHVEFPEDEDGKQGEEKVGEDGCGRLSQAESNALSRGHT